jgi:hypothetical protein
VAPCARCGTFLCGACTEVMGEEAYCADCIAWLHKNGPVSRAVQVFIALEIVSIISIPLSLRTLGLTLQLVVGGAVVGGAGLSVSMRELRRIQRGEGPLRGARQAKVARALAVVSLVLGVVGAAGILYLRLRLSAR